MISDEERRRIAKMLRDATEGHGDVPGIPDSEVFCILEIGTGFADGFADKADVEALADLIDRPTCHNASGRQDMCAQKPKARKRAIYLVTDFGGDWEDAWERPAIAFTDKARAEECAAKRETRQYDEYGPIWDYEGSEVKEIPLVDFGDRQEEK